jgi:hypothetical protein
MGYLASGMWDADLSPQRFIERYCRALFGEAAAPIVAKAFAVLEENEQELGGRGQANMPWNKVPPQIEVLRRFREHRTPFLSAPYDERFVQGCRERARKYARAVEHLERAGALYHQARAVASEHGRRELEYLGHRNLSYLHHLCALIVLSELYAAYRQAFGLLDRDPVAFRRELERIVTEAERAETLARESAKEMARCAEHPTDLGVLWMISSSMVTGTRVLREYLSNVLAYYAGREYWSGVAWELLFGTCPFPTYGSEEMAPSPLAPGPDVEEPG